MRAELEARVFIQGRNITKFPLDMQEAVSKLGLKKPVELIYSTRLHNDLDAMITETERCYYISVNAHRPLEDQRFAVGHEMGHFRLKHEPIRIDGWDMHEEFQEIEADEFATELLMPASRVYTLANKYRYLLQLIDKAQEYFGVSLQVAASQITHLDIFRGAIILTNFQKTETYFSYFTSDFYEDSECKHCYTKKVAPDRLLCVLVAETYRHVVRWEIG